MAISKQVSASFESDLVGNLEDFGISKYEARAYITLLEKGILGASDIAYHSNLPRTKIYTTLKKLEKKGLSMIVEHKPLSVSAISPQEAFAEIVRLNETRLKNMKKIVQLLKRIEDAKKISGIEEKKYTILDPKFVDQKVCEHIQFSKSAITAMVDSWGLSILNRNKDALTSAIYRGVDVKLLISSQCLGNSNIKSLPKGLEIRLHHFSDSIMIVDSSKIISIDSTNGKAAILSLFDPIGEGYKHLFEERWINALKIDSIETFDHKMLMQALSLKKNVESKLSEHILDHVSKPNPDLQIPPYLNALIQE